MLGASLNSLKHRRIPWGGGPLSLAHSLVHFPDTKWAHPTKVPHILYLQYIFICLFLDPPIFFWHKLQHFAFKKKCMPSPQQKKIHSWKSLLSAASRCFSTSGGIFGRSPSSTAAWKARGSERSTSVASPEIGRGESPEPLVAEPTPCKKNIGIKPKTGWRKNLRCLKHFETNQLS